MVNIDATLQQDAPALVCERLAAWVRRVSRKELAREIGSDPRTVQSWAEGNPPQFKHLVAMATLWGPAFLKDIFDPVLEPRNAADLALDLRHLESEIARVREVITREFPAQNMAQVVRNKSPVSHGARDDASGRSHESNQAAQRVSALARQTGLALLLALSVLTGISGFDDEIAARTARATRTVRTVRGGRNEGGIA